MTDNMRVCDSEITSCRQSIEWGYAKTSNVFSICTNANDFELGNKTPVSTQ
jgi:hypothetical protein